MSGPRQGGGFMGYFGLGNSADAGETIRALAPFIIISVPMLGGISYLLYHFELLNLSPWIFGAIVFFAIFLSFLMMARYRIILLSYDEESEG